MTVQNHLLTVEVYKGRQKLTPKIAVTCSGGSVWHYDESDLKQVILMLQPPADPIVQGVLFSFGEGQEYFTRKELVRGRKISLRELLLGKSKVSLVSLEFQPRGKNMRSQSMCFSINIAIGKLEVPSPDYIWSGRVEEAYNRQLIAAM